MSIMSKSHEKCQKRKLLTKNPEIFVPCCPEITTPLLVDDIFFKIDERIIIFLWKGVKCLCGGVRNPSRTIPDGSGHLRPNFNFFSISKKALFLWYTFGQNHHSTDHFDHDLILHLEWLNQVFHCKSKRGPKLCQISQLSNMGILRRKYTTEKVLFFEMEKI